MEKYPTNHSFRCVIFRKCSLHFCDNCGIKTPFVCMQVCNYCVNKKSDIHIIVLSLRGMSSLLETQKDLKNIECNWSGRLEAGNNTTE